MTDDWDPSGNKSQDEGNDDEATRMVSSDSAAGSSADKAIRPGDLLSHTYRIEEVLARGGMGEIYRARHTEMDTEHAIKIVLPEMASNPKVVDLFRREAGVLRNLRHAAVVAYDGVFRDEYDRVFLVMEYVNGPRLTDLLRERKLRPAEVRVLRDRLASGLAAAHEQGIVHRDISPDNILLEGGRLDDAKIIDFGIAKLSDPKQETILGDDFAGKYSYVSPEQLGMFGGSIDGRSDIYSLGLVLVAAALGRPLDMGASPASVMAARQKIPDLSDVPAELQDELASMLEPDPKDRPQTMGALVGLGGPEPAARKAAAPPSETAARLQAAAKAPAAKSGGSKGLLWGALAVVLLAAVGFGAFTFLGSKEETQTAELTGGSDAAPEETESQSGETATSGEAARQSSAGDPPLEEEPHQEVSIGGVTLDSPTPADPEPSVGGVTMDSPAEPEPTPVAEPVPVAEPAIVPEPLPVPDPAPETSTEPATEPVEAENTQTAQVVPVPKLPDLSSEKINAELVRLACAQLGGDLSGDGSRLTLRGHLPRAEEANSLRWRLLEIEGLQQVETGALVTLPEPNCEIIQSLTAAGLPLSREQVAAKAALGEPTQLGTLTFHAGEFLTLTLSAPDYGAYFYVDYYDNANNVIHLLPSPVATNNNLAPFQEIRIGGTDRYTISPPFGLDLVVAIGSSSLLFSAPRPEVEPADQYRAALMQALQKARSAGGFRGEYSYLFVETKQ
jgi:serine/threonine protein kinase